MKFKKESARWFDTQSNVGFGVSFSAKMKKKKDNWDEKGQLGSLGAGHWCVCVCLRLCRVPHPARKCFKEKKRKGNPSNEEFSFWCVQQ